jgi:hypothetical protein
LSPSSRERLPELNETARIYLSPDFPDCMAVSAWRLRHFPGKPSVSDDFLLK